MYYSLINFIFGFMLALSIVSICTLIITACDILASVNKNINSRITLIIVCALLLLLVYISSVYCAREKVRYEVIQCLVSDGKLEYTYGIDKGVGIYKIDKSLDSTYIYLKNGE